MRPRLYRWPSCFHFIVLITAAAASAQTLVNTGDPLRVAYACAEPDLQWAGMSCSDNEPCPVYLELNSVAAGANKVLAAGDLHSSSVTLDSVLLESDDSGVTWREPAPRLRGSAIDQLQLYPPRSAWAAGETQYPLPRDPFFLLTTDGGASWRQRPIGEEGSAGAVQRFWFDSPDHGEAIVDAGKTSPGGRYRSWESDNGGDTWIERGASGQLPKLRRAPASTDNPDWRLRTLKDGKAFQIEQRVQNQWKTVASFLIEVANCRASTADPREPAPEPAPAPAAKP